MDLFPLYLTIKVSFIASVFTVAVGLLLALLMARRAFPGKDILDVLIMQPLVMPPTV
ncbi:MAG: molybdate ABC transporter permease subunit, partial [Deltaproteobacteria bacterium]|nr:molybdate ABC transporter permease subunit [Deltaproteobacteria bacterium]